MFKLISVACFIALAGAPGLYGLTESEAVLMALEKNPDLKVSRITLRQDSLLLKSVQSQSGPQVELTGQNLVEYHPATSNRVSVTDSTGTASTLTTDSKSLTTQAGIDASQTVPGGGKLIAGLGHATSSGLDTGTASFATTGWIAFSQPLLKGAWANADVYYSIKQQKLSLDQSREAFKRDLLQKIHDIRSDYWDWIFQQRTVEIRRLELEYSRNALDFSRNQFKLGDKAELDTLSSYLEYLGAQEQLISAEYLAKVAANQLRVDLELAPEQLTVPPDLNIPLSPLPPAGQILERAKASQSALTVLDLTRRSLELQLSRQSNALLPRLDAEAGLNFGRSGGGVLAGDQGSSFDPYVGVRLTFDLLSRQTRYARRQTSLDLEKNQVQKEKILKQVTFQVEEFVDAWHQDSSRLDIAAAKVVIAEKNHSVALESYQLGTIDNLAKTKAQNDLINAKLNQLLAEINLKKIEIAVDQATAHALTTFKIELP